MAEKYKFTNEAKAVFNYIKSDLIGRFPTSVINPMYFIYSVLSNKDCIAYKTLEKILISENLVAIEDACHDELSDSGSNGILPDPKYDAVYDACLLDCGENDSVIDTCTFLISMINQNKETSKLFGKFGVTVSELKDNMEVGGEQIIVVDKPKSKTRRVKKTIEQKQEEVKKKQNVQKQTYDNTEVEKNLINISKLADEGKIDEAIGNDEVINKIFTALLKRDRNNVILVGDSGSGKTCTVKHIANLISEGNVPKYFANKRLMQMDFMSLLSGTGFRGGFEAKYQGIIEAAEKGGRYIFFLDDIHSILSPNSKFSEVSTDVILEDILSNKNIMFIATTNYDGYSKYILGNKTLARRFEKITLEEKKGEDLVKIINKVSAKYEKFHNVKYSSEVIDKAIELSDRFLGGSNIYTVTDVLDAAAANELIKHGKDKKLDQLKAELDEIKGRIDEFKSTTDSYDVYDDLCRKQIEKQSEINKYEKEANLNRKTLQVTLDSLYKTVSEKTNISVGSVSTSERDRLKTIDSVIKSKVIGQDSAVETICRSVRRQRVGMGNPDSPVTFLFVGTSGVGKTYLAKKLSEEVFGDEKSMVRLDMSEYADKISANKLIGSSAGYVGYEEGGLLTEAIKKNNHCVLLLDEIEKANEEIFNMFLQVFDEGRLTDNKGVTVDFRNVIIIMTSNIGTKEAAEFKGPIGFGNKNENVQSHDIIMKTIKKKLPPEFINRIDEIVFFNKLTDENLHEIIKIEIGKVEKRVKRMGYSFDETIKNGKLVDSIFDEVKKESEYGARPILREIQRQLEDKLTDFLLDNNVKKGYVFKYEDIYR